ncbi:radical SAM/SPASM domain-containing protein [Lachnospiraceae bacterium C1.1]|nr:radical SAM protein [Lachnospiraceae bacterium C1.1]
MEPIFEEEEVEMEIDLDKRFQFPNDVVIKRFENKNLVIYTEGVLWLVFSDDEQKVYNALSSGLSIKEALENFDEDTVISVISQIEAKQFEHPIVRESDDKNIYIYLTNNCNERCKHCYMYAGDVEIQEMSAEMWKSVLSDYKNCGGKGVTFTGGEVKVYREFEAVLRYADELDLTVTVLTNGILWNDSDIKRCAPYIDEIQISIDGYDKESYFKVRQFDGFDKAISTMIRFSDAGVRTSMAVTPLYDDIEEFVKNFEPFARNIIDKYPKIYIRFNLELLDGRDVRKTQIDNLKYRKIIKELVERLYPNYYLESFPLNYEGHVIRKNCGFGEIAIAANGDVYWCNRIHELSSKWNVITSRFEDIVNAADDIKKTTDVDNSATCRHCEVKYICGGDCRMNYHDIRNADTHLGMWNNQCPKGTKEALYRKMVLSNEYFFLDVNEG